VGAVPYDPTAPAGHLLKSSYTVLPVCVCLGVAELALKVIGTLKGVLAESTVSPELVVSCRLVQTPYKNKLAP